MAEKAEKKAPAANEKKEAAKAEAAAPAAEGAEASAKKEPAGIAALLSKTPVLLGGVMLLEAIVLFAGVKFLGAGAKSANADLTTALKADSADGGAAAAGDQDVEIPLVDDKFANRLSGRTFLYDVAMSLMIKSQNADKVKKTISDNDALIRDRVRTIIATMDPEKLGGGSEPGLETLRRQVKYQLDEIVGDGMIDEVLVPKCLYFRTDY
jgi:flagellar basal body-associated protein FliL